MFLMAVLTLLVGVVLLVLSAIAGLGLETMSYVWVPALLAGLAMTLLGLMAVAGTFINRATQMYSICTGLALAMLMIVTTISGPMLLLSTIFGANPTPLGNFVMLALMCLTCAAYAATGAVVLAPRKVDPQLTGTST